MQHRKPHEIPEPDTIGLRPHLNDSIGCVNRRVIHGRFTPHTLNVKAFHFGFGLTAEKFRKVQSKLSGTTDIQDSTIDVIKGTKPWTAKRATPCLPTTKRRVALFTNAERSFRGRLGDEFPVELKELKRLKQACRDADDALMEHCRQDHPRLSFPRRCDLQASSNGIGPFGDSPSTSSIMSSRSSTPWISRDVRVILYHG
jgi:hypothetical protein